MKKITFFQSNDGNSRGILGLRKAGLAVALSALMLAPLGFAAAPAQAAPHRDHRINKRDDRRHHGKPGPGRPGWSNNRPGNRPGWSNNRPGNRPGYSNSETILRGTVVRDLPGNQFSVRTSRGITRVITNSEPRALTAGDYVEIRGRYSGSNFNARDINIIRNR